MGEPPRVPTFGGNPKEVKDWLVSIEKGQLIYELSDRETVYVAFNAAVVTVLNFIGDHMVMDPHLSKDLEELLIGEYADEGMVIEAT